MQFVDLLGVESCTFDLGEALQSSETGAGEIITASLGVRLWSATIKLKTGYHGAVAQQTAVLNMLREPGRSFFAHDKARQFPAADPGGYIFGAAAPTIASLPSSNREIGIAGLPASYILTPGDRVSFSYGSSPTRYAMHEIVVGGMADASGALTVEVTPNIRTGATVGAALTFVRPQIKAIVAPSSTQIGTSSGRVTAGATFKILQTLR
ncbi:MAG: hypothetical protein PF443_07855 [Allgaiera sp.]|nr:hypothetical protein [Allgaiera sp.]